MNPLMDPTLLDDLVPDIPLKARALLIIAAVFLVGALISLPFALLLGGLGWGFFYLFIATTACYATGAGVTAVLKESD